MKKLLVWIFLTGFFAGMASGQSHDAEPQEVSAKWQKYRDTIEMDISLVLYYTFEEGSGPNTWNRARGEKKNLSVGGIEIEETASPTEGTIYGARWSKDSRIPNKTCLSFNGKGTDGVSCGNDPVINNLKQKTILAWIKVIGKGWSGLGRIINKTGNEKGPAYSPGWILHVTNPDEQGKCQISYLQNFSERAGAWACSSKLEMNRWYLVAVSHDNTSVSNQPKFYINGESSPCYVNEGGKGSVPDDSIAKMTLGIMTDSNYWSFEGLMDEVLVFNRCLTDEEVKDLFIR